MKILELVIIIIGIGIFIGMIAGIISYLKACARYYYNPVNAIDCPLAFASIAILFMGVAFAKAIAEASPLLIIMAVIIGAASVIVSIGLIGYSIKRIYERTGSWKFAIASYPVEVAIVYLGLMSMGIFMLGAYMVVKKISE